MKLIELHAAITLNFKRIQIRHQYKMHMHKIQQKYTRAHQQTNKLTHNTSQNPTNTGVTQLNIANFEQNRIYPRTNNNLEKHKSY